MSSLDYLDLCRLCLVKDRVGIPIFEDEGDVRQVFLKIAACLPVKVSREDKLPKKICDDCMYKLELFYQFWNTTANAEKQLLQWLNDVDMQDKQGYVTGVLNTSILKQEQQASENRLDGSVMQQVGTHQNNMGMGMMDNMGLSMPLIISSSNQQLTSVPMDTSGSNVQTVQAVPGPSSQATHDQIPQNHGTNVSGHHDDDEDSTDDEENESDDECDGDDGLPVKEESEEDPNRTIEPTTFVNVSLPCDEAGPSGLQQQKMPEMPEMAMPQVVNADNKTGLLNINDERGVFFCGKETVIMRKWQIIEFDDKPFYAFVPESETDFQDEVIDNQETCDYENKIAKIEQCDEQLSECSNNDEEYHINNEEYLEENDEYEIKDVKPIITNDSNKENEGTDSPDKVYQVNVNGRMITIEKVNIDSLKEIPYDDNESSSENGDENESLTYDSFLDDVNDTEQKINILSKKAKKSPILLKCKECLETFESNLTFRKHVAWTHKKKICIQENGAYICSVCDYKTLKKSSFASHLERKHETWSNKPINSVMFPCTVCGFVCSSKHSLQSHFIRKHTDKYEHECQFCMKKFKVKGDLTNHVRFHHKEKPVSCDVCGKLCQNSGSLYVHQKWAHFKPKFECHICHRRMVTQENLDQHLISQHEKREKIVCAECGKTFTKKDSFKRHMAVHTGSKPHACMICAKNFARRSQLRQHLLIHTGKKPFVCDICGKSFAQKPGLICHRKIHPGNHPPLPVMPIGDLVKELTDEFEVRQENRQFVDEEFLEGQEMLNGEEVLEEEQVMGSEEIYEEEEILEGGDILEGTEVIEEEGIYEGQRVFYEHEMTEDSEFADHQFRDAGKYEVDREFLSEQEFHEALGIQGNEEIDD